MTGSRGALPVFSVTAAASAASAGAAAAASGVAAITAPVAVAAEDFRKLRLETWLPIGCPFGSRCGDGRTGRRRGQPDRLAVASRSQVNRSGDPPVAAGERRSSGGSWEMAQAQDHSRSHGAPPPRALAISRMRAHGLRVSSARRVVLEALLVADG